jgi:imidazoleglycerol-phosphate dehydratase/histidinol-phosphatase
MKRKILYIERNGGLLTAAAKSTAANALPLPAAGVLAALRRFVAVGYELIVLDDASGGDHDDATDGGVVRAADDTDQSDRFLRALLESQGITVRDWRRCTHGDKRCDCRLPGLGLVRPEIGDSDLNRENSLIVGSRVQVAELAANCGIPARLLSPVGGPVGRPMNGAADGAFRSWTALAADVLDRHRTAQVRRKTKETDIQVELNLDLSGDPAISTGIGFFDHMLEQLGKHGGFLLRVHCAGDLKVDEHHTVEDVALAVGEALKQALGEKRGISRYGFLLPMDEAEVQVALDLSGRAYFVFEGEFPREAVGELPTELVPHFFRSLSDALGATLHIKGHGENTHHMIEACFKGVARTLRDACARIGDAVPSTKGAL